MIDDMGTFRTDVEIENPANPGTRRMISNALIDAGAKLSGFPRAVLEELRVEPATKRLVDAGPAPAAAAA